MFLGEDSSSVDNTPSGPIAWLVRVVGWLFATLVFLLGMSTCMGLYENPHNHNSPLLGVAILAFVVGAMVVVAFGGAFQWAATWRFLFSANFRQHLRERWSHASHAQLMAQASFAAFSFLVINLFFGLVLWRLGS